MAHHLHIARTPGDIADFARLCRDYAASLPFSLEYQGFTDELASLPGLYAPPTGAIILARDEELTAVACIAVRPLAASAILPGDPTPACEIKRMWVAPSARGCGLGHALMHEAIAFARGAGYALIKLDTSAEMAAAQSCYRRAGFEVAPRYNDDVDPTTVYFAMRL